MIGIIAAEEKEINEILKLMTNINEIKIFEKIFYTGLIEEKNIVVVKSNVGKVNSSRICQMMIDKFDIELIINVGTAGSVSNELDIGDVVIAKKLVQYDFDVTAFGRKLGEIENIGENILVNKNLLELFNGLNVKYGTISSGDKFVYKLEEKNYIRETFDAVCVEMEGASIAQVCLLCNIPFLVIRSITDKLDGSSKMEFEEFLSLSSKNASKILKEVIKKYCSLKTDVL